MDIHFQNGKLASKKNIDQDKSVTKEKTLQLNKRTLKSIEKDFIKQKKLQRSHSVDGASRENIEEEEESQIICTKSRGLKGLKRQKRNVIEKKVLSEMSKEDKEELHSLGQIKRQEIEQPPNVELKLVEQMIDVDENLKDSPHIKELEVSYKEDNTEEEKSN